MFLVLKRASVEATDRTRCVFPYSQRPMNFITEQSLAENQSGEADLILVLFLWPRPATLTTGQLKTKQEGNGQEQKKEGEIRWEHQYEIWYCLLVCRLLFQVL